MFARAQNLQQWGPARVEVSATKPDVLLRTGLILSSRFPARAVRSLIGMAGVGKFEDLVAWQLSVALRDRILELTEDGPAARDADFKDDIRRSARSAPNNLSEGFGAFYPREFARFSRIARRSIMETRNHILDAKKQKYFSDDDINKLTHLTFRAQKATTGLIKYLDSCKGRPPAGWDFTQ